MTTATIRPRTRNRVINYEQQRSDACRAEWHASLEICRRLKDQLGYRGDPGWGPAGEPIRLSAEQVNDLAFQLAWDPSLLMDLACLVGGHITECLAMATYGSDDGDSIDQDLADALRKAATYWNQALLPTRDRLRSLQPHCCDDWPHPGSCPAAGNSGGPTANYDALPGLRPLHGDENCTGSTAYDEY